MLKIFKNSIGWFFCMPIIIIGIAQFFVPLRSDALYTKLMEQREIESKIALLGLEIRSLLDQNQTQHTQEQVDNLCSQLKKYKVDLLAYKHDWGWTVSDALKVYIENGTVAVGDTYLGLMWFMMMGVLFQIVAITPYVNIPLYIRAGSISSGVVITGLVMSQWIFAALYAPLWYSALIGVIVVLVLLIGVIVSCYRFKNFKI